MIDFAVFDMAGTTISDKNFVAKAFQKAFMRRGIEVLESEANPLMGYAKPVAIEMILQRKELEFDAVLVDKIHHDFVDDMMDFYQFSPYVKAMPDTEDVFFFLKEHGVKIALNTGFSKDIAEVILDRFQWMERGLVDDFICSDEVPEGRPYPYMIDELKTRNHLDSDAIVMKVGDTVADVLEGKNAGCRLVIAVTTGAASREELEEHFPTHIISNLSEIPGILSQSIQYV